MANEVKPNPAPAGALSKDDITSMIREAVSSAVAVGMALGKTAEGPAVAKMDNTLAGQCGQCGQRLTACKNKHRLAVVFPTNPRYADPKRGGWVGVQLNNVTYRSNSPHHKVCIPFDFCPENIVAMWEQTEDTMSQGRVGGQHLARMSPSAMSFNPDMGAGGWR